MEKEPSTDEKQQLKNTLKSIFSRKDALLILAILFFSVIVQLYFFSITINQPLWWDEAEYLSAAKYFLYDTEYNINPQRPPLFPFLIFLLLKLSLQETMIKLLIVVFPSIAAVLLSYLLVKEMYDSRTALLVGIITTVSWIHLFYSMRLMTDAIGLLFGLASVYCFWKGYVKPNSKYAKYYIWLIGPFVALSMMVRLTGVLYGLVIFLFLIITDKGKFITSKALWISFILSLVTLIPLFTYDSIIFDNALAFRSGYGGIPDQGLGWQMLSEVYNYPEKVFFFAFVIGSLISLNFLLSLDLIIKKKTTHNLNDLFMWLTLVVVLGFFIYFLRQAENRWMMFMSLAIFTFAAKGILKVYDLLKKYHKEAAILVVIIILIAGAYFQLQHANSIIIGKRDSYIQIKDASLWMRDNSEPNEAMLSVSYTQTTAYSDRPTYSYSSLNQTDFFDLVKEKQPKYILISALEPHHPEWIFAYAPQHPEIFIPRQAYYLDPSQQQVVAVVYEIDLKNIP